MQHFVNQYVWNCHTCTCTKTPRHAKFEVLQPLPVPQHCWKDMTMDFIVSLSLVNGYDSVCVLVNWLTKERHLTACHFIITSEGLADLFIHDIFRLHELPDSVTSDRGPQFIGAAWKRVCRKLEIKAQLSTAFHPETDNQTEKINGVICHGSQALWSLVS